MTTQTAPATCTEWLREYLRDGRPHHVSDIQDDSFAEHFLWPSVTAAANRLGVQMKPADNSVLRWSGTWSLPKAEDP